MGAHNSNDPSEIVKDDIYSIYSRLIGDANKIKSMSAIDKGVLQRLVDDSKTPKSERDSQLVEILRCMEKIEANASEAADRLKRVRDS